MISAHRFTPDPGALRTAGGNARPRPAGGPWRRGALAAFLALAVLSGPGAIAARSQETAAAAPDSATIETTAVAENATPDSVATPEVPPPTPSPETAPAPTSAAEAAGPAADSASVSITPGPVWPSSAAPPPPLQESLALHGGSAGTPTPAVTAPANLGDISAWLDYKTHGHLLALPQEARIFYRRGLMLHASGGRDEALKLVRGAARLDPGFVAPHLTLAGWLLFSDPGETLEHCDAVLRMARSSFMIQLVVAANALYLILQSLFLALLLAALVVVALNQDRLRHGWIERLVPFVTPETAVWWSWAILLAPYLAGLGPALPTIVFLGLLWPMGKLRERTLFVALTLVLAGVPLLTAALDRLSAPLQGDRGPFYGVPQLQAEPYSPELRAEVERRAAAHPDSPFLLFGAAWVAQRAGDPVAAEGHYRRVLELWPDDPRVLNNLGNALAAQGRGEEALAAYGKAAAADTLNAAPHFNASQIHTQSYDFHAANEELAKASALDFELVKSYQSERAEAKWAALVDLWITPPTFWKALRQVPLSTTAAGALPPLWRTRVECSGWMFSMLALVLAIGSLALGLFFHHGVPVRSCTNCGRAVCRRCHSRRRELALCADCAVTESRAQSHEFGRVLLGQRRRRLQQRRDMVFRIIGVLVPGFGYLPYRKLFRVLACFATAAALVSASLGIASPFSFEPRFAVPGHDVPLAALVLTWLAFYAVSVPIYLAFEERARLRVKTLGTSGRTRVQAPPAPTQTRAAA